MQVPKKATRGHLFPCSSYKLPNVSARSVHALNNLVNSLTLYRFLTTTGVHRLSLHLYFCVICFITHSPAGRGLQFSFVSSYLNPDGSFSVPFSPATKSDLRPSLSTSAFIPWLSCRMYPLLSHRALHRPSPGLKDAGGLMEEPCHSNGRSVMNADQPVVLTPIARVRSMLASFRSLEKSRL